MGPSSWWSSNRAREPPVGLPPDAIVFEAPAEDPDGDFAALVGRFAAALDDGTDAADAFRSSLAEEGWTEAIAGLSRGLRPWRRAARPAPDRPGGRR